jgi:hypothetical protein
MIQQPRREKLQGQVVVVREFHGISMATYGVSSRMQQSDDFTGKMLMLKSQSTHQSAEQQIRSPTPRTSIGKVARERAIQHSG